MIRLTRATVSSIQVVAGAILICFAVVGYAVTHLFFFGVPDLSPVTLKGKLDLAYTLATIAITGIGAYSLYCGIKKRWRTRD